MQTISLPFAVKRTMLACGADMKGAFAVAKGRKARLYTGFGDLSDLDNFERYERAIRREVRAGRPAFIVSDLHPGYASTRLADTLVRSVPGTRTVTVQHHEAHAAAAIVDHGIAGRVIAVSCDGTGLGGDGALWGGEFFAGSLRGFERMAHLAYVPQPGGDSAVREPWRMAAAYLRSVYRPRRLALSRDPLRTIDAKRRRLVESLMLKRSLTPLTSSMGRFFDAVGSMVLGRATVSKEAELPMALEKIAARGWADSYPFELNKTREAFIIDPAKTVRAIVSDLGRGVKPAIISGTFHNTIAEMILRTCEALRKKMKTNMVVLTGGVFQNKVLSDRALFLLSVAGFRVYRQGNVPVNDEGIPIGQIAIAYTRGICA